LEVNRLHQWDIDFPFPEPLCTLNRGRHVSTRVMYERRARNLPLAAHEIDAPTSTSKSLRSKTSTVVPSNIIRHTTRRCAFQIRTDMASASERNTNSESADATTDNGNLKLLESRRQRGRGESRHQRDEIEVVRRCRVMGHLAY
jgi:hypothetical protein